MRVCAVLSTAHARHTDHGVVPGVRGRRVLGADDVRVLLCHYLCGAGDSHYDRVH